jgi:hypothetical protein
MARTSALWTRRSTRETTQAAFGKTSRHSAKGRLVVTSGELAEQLTGAGEQHGVTVDECLMGDVASEH